MIKKGYWAVWNLGRESFLLVVPIRFNLIVLLLLFAALLVPGQSRDVFRTMAEDSIYRSLFSIICCSLVASFTFWYTTFEMLCLLPPVSKWPGFQNQAIIWTSASAGVIPSLIVSIGCFFSRSEIAASGALLRQRLLWLGLSAVLEALVLLLLFLFVSKHRATVVGEPKHRAVTRFGFGAALTGLIVPIIAAFVSPVTTSYVGPIATLFFAAACWSLILFPINVWLTRALRLPTLTILFGVAFLVGMSDCNDNHEIRKLATPAPPAPRAASALREWLSTRDDYVIGKKYPVFLVAAEGGGSRNAYWTSAVLGNLADRCPAFKHHLFAATGVSGGSVGLVVYAALIFDDENGGWRAHDPLQTRAREVLAHDLLSPVAAMATFPDLIQQVCPVAIGRFDRARGLEWAMEKAWFDAEYAHTMSRGFYSLHARGKRTDIPYLILNTTEVETGERVAVAHLIPTSSPHASIGAFSQVVPSDIRLSTAAFVGARFPAVTPAATVRLADGRKLRYVDGGYFENSSTATLLDLLRELETAVTSEDPNIQGPRLKDAEFFVILPMYVLKGPLGLKSSPHSFGEIASPIRALLKTREARASFSVHELERHLSEAADRGFKINRSPLRFECYDAAAPIPLGWMLSRAAQSVMDDQLPPPVGRGGTKENQDASDAVCATLRIHRGR